MDAAGPMNLTWFRRTRSWTYVASSLMVACALLVAHGYREHLQEPARDEAAAVSTPARGPAQDARAAELERFKPLPVEARNGWLPASRHDSRPFFDVRKCAVDLTEMVDMAPGVGDIPSLDRPSFVSARSVDWLSDGDEVLGLQVGRASRCYPLSLLRWHGVVNDAPVGTSVAIVFDPLSGAAVALRRVVGGKPITLEFSGKAYRGIGVLYDKESRNLWHPLRGGCIAGPMTTRVRLQALPLRRTTWKHWRAENRQTQVLSRNTGFQRPYGLDPYAVAPMGPDAEPVDYWQDPNLMLAPLPPSVRLNGLQPKRQVLGLLQGREALAVLAPPTASRGPTRFHMEFGGQQLSGVCDLTPGGEGFFLEADEDTQLRQVRCYWFAWKASYPATGLKGIGGG